MITFNDNIARKPYLGSTPIAEIWLAHIKIYPDGPADYSKDYLTFDILQSGNIGYTLSSNTLQYSKDGGKTWTDGSPDTNIPVNAGDKVSVKFTNPVLYREDEASFETNGICNFYTDCNFNLYGNVMSLLYGDDFKERVILPTMQDNYGNTVDANHLLNLFFGCTGLISAENLVLPATTLTDLCYTSMFQACSNLITAPELPATTLADYCYSSMFRSCTSLTIAPELPATKLKKGCYAYMFRSCTSLVNTPSVLPATTLAIDCYSSMFSNCTSLTTAPELPATTLARTCYNNMFQGCSNLNYIKAMFTTTPSTTYTNNWVNGVAATGTFVKNSGATWNVTGNHGIPNGWTVTTE